MENVTNLEKIKGKITLNGIKGEVLFSIIEVIMPQCQAILFEILLLEIDVTYIKNTAEHNLQDYWKERDLWSQIRV